MSEPLREDGYLLGLLCCVAENANITQRGLAREMGIAVGLANTYLKRCVNKGWVKVSQAPARRYAYYLTPQGFSEKSRLTAEYLSTSLSFFRKARMQCRELLELCTRRGWSRIVVIGRGDLQEIAQLTAMEFAITLVRDLPFQHKDRCSAEELTAQLLAARDIWDAVLFVKSSDAQQYYDALVAQLPAERVLAMPLLRIHPPIEKADVKP